MIIYTRNNCVPCVRLKQWMAEAKRDNREKAVIHTFLHSIEFVNIDEVPEKKDYLIDLGVKSVPCLIEDNTQYIGHEVIMSHLDDIIGGI